MRARVDALLRPAQVLAEGQVRASDLVVPAGAVEVGQGGLERARRGRGR